MHQFKIKVIDIFYTVAGGIFLWLLLNILFSAQYVDPTTYGGTFGIKNYYNPFYLLLFTTIITTICFYIYKILLKIKVETSLLVIMMLLILVIQIIFAYNLMFDISEPTKFTDLGILIDAAQSILDTGTYSNSYNDYFYNTPYQAGVLGEFILWYRFMEFFGVFSLNLSCVILNILSIDISIIGLYYLTKECINVTAAKLTLVLSLIFSPFFTYVTYFYTDTLSMPFPVLSLLIYILLNKYEKKENHNEYILLGGYSLLGLILAVGILIKASVIVCLIAILIHMFLNKFNWNKILWVQLLLFIIIFLQFVSIRVIDSKGWFPYQLSTAAGYPHSMWFLMGTNEERYGAYAPEDVNITLSELSYERRKEKATAALQNRLETNGLEWYLKFLTKKNAWMWGDGKYYAAEVLAWFPHQRDSKFLKFFSQDADGSKAFGYWSQGIQIMLLGMILLSWKGEKKVQRMNSILVVNISIFGIFLFLSLWEARPRYLLNMTPLFLFAAANGFDHLIRKRGINEKD